jgi:DNA-binding phage protein
MKQKFRALKQGHHSVDEYLGEFEHLSRYAPRDVEDEKEKIQAFLNGLCEELHEKLVTHDFPDFRTLVDTARLAERASISLELVCKCKHKAF